MNAPTLVVDASIAVKWVVSEREDAVEHAQWILELCARRKVVLAVPALFRLEWLNALRSRGVSVPDVLAAAHAVETSGLIWHEVDEALSFEAVALAASHGLTVYDAAYLALAERLDAGLLTADSSLAAAAGDRLVHVADLPSG